jgi:hypothetical protein
MFKVYASILATMSLCKAARMIPLVSLRYEYAALKVPNGSARHNVPG